ncbi:MAG TPA: O-antigen ligase family protein, partial [Tepidisphaeraceae bacterium]|nr:O-antigen ligase family protein [Tepidisphaeraceae bacterium]
RKGIVGYGVCLALSASALLLSETRGAWLGAGAALMVLGFVKNKWLPAALAVVVVGMYLAAPRHLQMRAESIFEIRDESTAARLNMWSTGANMIRAHPWLGVGPNQITALAYQYGGNPKYAPQFFTHLHNNFLQLAAERGLPGLAAWLWLLGQFFWDTGKFVRSRSRRDQPWAYGFGWGVMAAMIALVIAGMFEFNLGDSEVLMLVLLLLGSVYGLMGDEGGEAMGR